MRDEELNVLTDESIVKMAQEGSSTAYEYLIVKYKDLVKQKAKAYFIAGADNEDVIQEGMIGLFKAVRDFDPKRYASFRTFAGLCITRQIQTAIESAGRQKHRILNESLSLNAEAGEEEGTPSLSERLASSGLETDPESMMLMKEVVDFLKRNGQDLFSPLEMQVWNELRRGRNYREIAFVLHCPVKTVDNAMQRIKKKVEWFLNS